ncbi:heterokaryon incompatibility protein-domain-containing protein [Ustulina deusta]|nr:heterokaryon incompatibility protein-domain-containing protein [Ustulina deusta]
MAAQAYDVHPIYSDLTLESDEFRILKVDPASSNDIICSLERMNLNDHRPFDCLSYTWMNPLNYPESSPNVKEEHKNKFPESVILNEIPLSITRNLRQCLHVLQQKGYFQGGRRIWIDAICINQRDEEDVDSHMPQIGRLYAQAKQVVIWLGPEDHGSCEAVDVINRLAKVAEAPYQKNGLQYCDLEHDDPCSELGIEPRIHLEEWGHYIKFLQRSYFRRVWVAQETFFAQSISVFCGEAEILWNNLIKSAKVVQETGLAEALHQMSLSLTPGGNTDSLIKNSTNNQLILTIFGSQAREGLSIDKLLYFTQYLEAEKPEDKVFGVLGIWLELILKGGSKPSNPNFRWKVPDVYSWATFTTIQEIGDLNILRLAGPSSPANGEFPSWVPDYSCFPQLHAITVRKSTSVENSSAPDREEHTWRADGKRNPHQFVAKRDSNRLYIRGIPFQTIEYIGLSYSELEIRLEFGSILDTLFEYPSSRSPYGLDYSTAWYQTLIANRFRDRPADDVALGAFRLLVAFYVKDIDEVLEISDEYDKGEIEDLKKRKKRLQKVISDLAARGSNHGVIPSLEEIEEIGRTLKGDRESPRARQLDRDVGDIRQSFEKAYKGRRLFRTAGNYLGIAPDHLKVGDQVWILSGADTPYVLRKSDRDWRAIGEAYVHGIMHGEAANAPFQNLSLV